MNGQIDILEYLTPNDKDKITPIESTEWRWTFKDYPKEKNGLKVFSCFACGGGSTMGYKLAGCEVLGDVEIDPAMNEIYVLNHKPKYNFLMDIREFNQLENLPDDLYNLDILDGSPPCTTFSMAGEREKNWGKEKAFREGQTAQILDELAFVFIDTVRKLKPRVVIMENVEGLLLGEAYAYVKNIYDGFNDAGYKLHHWLLKGEQMGVPQTRHRVFFIGIRKDLKIDPTTLDMTFNYAPVPFGEIKEGDGIQLNTNTKAYKCLSKATPQDLSLADTYLRIGEKKKCFSDKIIWEQNVMQTITAVVNHYRGSEKTYISPADVINAQTFPRDFDFKLTKPTANAQLRKITYVCGMSVPPLMIKRIVTRLIEQGVFDYRKEAE